MIIPTTENTCAIVVTYFPDRDFLRRFEKVLALGCKTVVVDNGSGEALPAIPDRAVAVRNATNRGIAAALNQGITWAMGHEYTWALLFDQDTVPNPDMFRRLAGAAEAFGSGKLAMVGSHFGAEYQAYSTDEAWVLVRDVINSGTLLSLAAFRNVGPFREDFFLDCVDTEFCLRARRCGFEIIELTTPVMVHSVGRESRHSLLGLKVRVSNHSSWRWYYMTRNNAILIGESLLANPRWAMRTIYSRLRATFLMLVFEQQRREKLKHVVLGLADALSGSSSSAPVAAPASDADGASSL